jgi:hypothetical protein
MLVAKYGAPGDKVPMTYREAHEMFEKRAHGLFGASAGGTASPTP